MATKILKTVFITSVITILAVSAYAGGPKDKSKKQDSNQVLEHQCDSSCEKSFSLFPLYKKSLTVDNERVCKKALLDYLKAEREKERNENDKEHINESISNDILKQNLN